MQRLSIRSGAAGTGLISIVIPAYNGAAFLESALHTVGDQNVPDVEVVLIDDGSTDELGSLARKHSGQARYIRQEHCGPAAARNRGVLESRGEFIAFLDIDDLWTRGQLPRLLQAFQSCPEAGIAQGLMRQVLSAPDGSCFQTAAYRLPYLGSCLFRRWVFDQCGLFDERMWQGEDYDFIFRCWENDVPKIDVDNVSLLYRRHPGNVTRGNTNPAHLLVLKRRIERIKSGLVDPAARRRVAFQTYIGDLTRLATGELELTTSRH